MMIRRMIATWLVLMSPIALVEAKPDPFEDKIYSRILPAFPINLYPPIAEDIHSQHILSQVADTLVRIDNNLLVPGIAKTWTISADRKTYRFTIDSNARFSNGKAIDSEDVRNAFHHFLSKVSVNWSDLSMVVGSEELHYGRSKKLRGFRKINDRSFELTLKNPYPPLLKILSSPNFSILPDESYHLLKEKKVVPFVSSGVYRLKTVQDGSSLALSINPHHHKSDEPYFRRIHYEIVKDEKVAQKGFESGRFFDIWPYFVKPRSVTRPLQKVPSFTAFSWYLQFNLNRPPVNDVAVRQFIYSHLDFDAFLEAGKLPSHYRAHGLIPRGLLGALKKNSLNLKPQPLEAIKEKCHSKAPCVIDLIFPYDRERELRALLKPLQRFEPIVRINVKKLPRMPWYKKFVNGDYQMVFVGNNPAYPDTYMFLRYLLKPKYHPGLKTATIKKTLEKALQSTNNTERRTLFGEVDKLVIEQIGVIPIYHGDSSFRYARADLEGYHIPLMGYAFLKLSMVRPKK